MAELNRRAAYAKLLGATDVQEIGALAEEYWHRHALGWTNSSTAGAMTFSKPLTVSDSLVLSGNGNVTGNLIVSGDLDLSGMSTEKVPIVNLTASDTLTAAQSGSLVVVTTDTTALVATMPAVTHGARYHFHVADMGNTAGDVTITPAATEMISSPFVGATQIVPTVKDSIFLDASDTSRGEGQFVTLVGNTLPASDTHAWVAVAASPAGISGGWKVST